MQDDRVQVSPPPNWWEKVATVEINQAKCSTEVRERMRTLEEWKKQQNGDIRSIRRRILGILISIILLLVGVLANIIVDYSRQPISDSVSKEVEARVEQIVQQTIDALELR
ncbi:hypothetical protein KKA53_05055 [Candidatus Dependentiae bacterium]|nr:hypothetical protein [Candidatus Dependentiae bacterium]